MGDKFENWMKKVDAAVEAIVGLSVHDLPDIDFMGLFEDGVGPKAVARKALAEAGW